MGKTVFFNQLADKIDNLNISFSTREKMRSLGEERREA